MSGPKMEAVANYSELNLKLYKVRLAKRLIYEVISYPRVAEEQCHAALSALNELEQDLHRKAINASEKLPSIYFEDESKL